MLRTLLNEYVPGSNHRANHCAQSASITLRHGSQSPASKARSLTVESHSVVVLMCTSPSGRRSIDPECRRPYVGYLKYAATRFVRAPLFPLPIPAPASRSPPKWTSSRTLYPQWGRCRTLWYVGIPSRPNMMVVRLKWPHLVLCRNLW
jgi:hypothetical protein